MRTRSSACVQLTTLPSRKERFGTITWMFSRCGCVCCASDALHVAVGLIHFDQVADLDRALREQDHTADEVCDDVLAAEADADRERTAEHGERRQRDVHRLQ